MINIKKMKWYVIQSYTGKENNSRNKIIEKIETNRLEKMFGRILIPSEEVIEIKSGKKRKSKRKFFPGYIIIEMIMNEKSWNLINSTIGINGFIGGCNRHPAPISTKEIKNILKSIKSSKKLLPKPKITFKAGQVVRILDGPFIDFTGVVEEINYEKSKLYVAVSIFGRSTPVELEFSQVEKDI